MATTEIESPLARLSPEQIEEIGAEFHAIHDEVFDDLGERDAKYIHSIIDLQRQLALGGRLILFGSRCFAGLARSARASSPWPRSWRTWRSATT